MLRGLTRSFENGNRRMHAFAQSHWPWSHPALLLDIPSSVHLVICIWFAPEFPRGQGLVRGFWLQVSPALP